MTVKQRIAQIEELLGISIPAGSETRIAEKNDKIAIIQRVVCFVCVVSFADLVSRKRTDPVKNTRKLGFLLCKEYGAVRNLTYLAKRFGCDNHATVIHANNTAKDMVGDGPGSDPNFQEQYRKCKNLLGDKLDEASLSVLNAWLKTVENPI